MFPKSSMVFLTLLGVIFLIVVNTSSSLPINKPDHVNKDIQVTNQEGLKERRTPSGERYDWRESKEMRFFKRSENLPNKASLNLASNAHRLEAQSQGKR